MKNYIVKYLMLYICLSSIASCQNPTNVKAKIIVKGTIGKKLILPDSIQTYRPFPNYIADSSSIFNSEFKIYTHINASCGTCVSRINSWNKIISKFSKYNIPVILICESDDKFELIKYLCESGEVKDFPYPFFFDIGNEFTKQNDFMEKVVGFETVLTDKNNNILLLGSPVRSKGILDLYMREIKKLKR